MAKNISHIVYCPFTGVGRVPYKGDEWFADRIEIFKNYTLKSLQNQTNKDIKLLLSFRPEEHQNPLMIPLVEALEASGFKFALACNGLIYYDDRNLEANKTLKERLDWYLEAVSGWQADWMYLTRLDSDDMLHKDVVELLQKEEPFEGALTLQLGYVFNKDTGEVAEWNPLTNPPFHTFVMKRETFFDVDKHLAFYGDWKSHEDTAKMPHKVIWREDDRRDRLYMVLTHNPTMHISTTWEHEFKGKSMKCRECVLKNFGL